jgi:hypothetical protein
MARDVMIVPFGPKKVEMLKSYIGNFKYMRVFFLNSVFFILFSVFCNFYSVF